MNIGDEEYLMLRDQFMKEEYDKTHPKPSSMYGHMGWFAIKEREFQEKLRTEGKLKMLLQEG